MNELPWVETHRATIITHRLCFSWNASTKQNIMFDTIITSMPQIIGWRTVNKQYVCKWKKKLEISPHQTLNDSSKTRKGVMLILGRRRTLLWWYQRMSQKPLDPPRKFFIRSSLSSHSWLMKEVIISIIQCGFYECISVCWGDPYSSQLSCLREYCFFVEDRFFFIYHILAVISWEKRNSESFMIS